MKVIVDMPNDVIDFFEQRGVIVNELDGGRYYNLPEWYRKAYNGIVTEIPFKELPDECKKIHLSYRDYQRVFTLDEMRKIYEAGQYDCGEFGSILGFGRCMIDTFGINISEETK